MNLPEPAKQLWLKAADAISEHLRKHLSNYKGWTIGGGTVLSARWHHRASTDIDLKLQHDAGLTGVKSIHNRAAAEELDERMRTLGATRIDESRANQLTIVFPEGRIDVLQAKAAIIHGSTIEQVEHRRDEVSSNAQILAGKTERWAASPTRDLFDIGVANRLDRRSLEIAVNRLPMENNPEAAAGWTSQRAYHQHSARTALLNVPTEWAEIATDPAGHAVQAWNARTYKTIGIEVSKGQVRLAVECNDGQEREETQEINDGFGLEKWLHETGLHGYLLSNGTPELRAEVNRARKHAEDFTQRPSVGTARTPTKGHGWER